MIIFFFYVTFYFIFILYNQIIILYLNSKILFFGTGISNINLIVIIILRYIKCRKRRSETKKIKRLSLKKLSLLTKSSKKVDLIGKNFLFIDYHLVKKFIYNFSLYFKYSTKKKTGQYVKRPLKTRLF